MLHFSLNLEEREVRASQQIICRQMVSPWLSCSEPTEILLRGLGYVLCSVEQKLTLSEFV